MANLVDRLYMIGMMGMIAFFAISTAVATAKAKKKGINYFKED